MKTGLANTLLIALVPLTDSFSVPLHSSNSPLPIPSRPTRSQHLSTGRGHLAMATDNTERQTPDTSAISDELLDQVLAVAIDASRRAGEIILQHATGAAVTKTKANPRDLLTMVDPLCESVIYDTVHATFPQHDFLGEEGVAPGAASSAAALDAKLHGTDATTTDTDDDGWLWIVDPIDGTTNFVHGMPLCMPSVAATYRGEIMVGVIFDCHRDELFTAVRGRGAQLNGRPMAVGTQKTLGDAVVAMGSPPAAESLAMSLKGVAALMPQVRTIRMLGSAALMLAWVANGRLTCYWEYDLSAWDVAAGTLLVREAGGRFTDLDGREADLTTRKICASNGKIHPDMIRVLRDEAGIV